MQQQEQFHIYVRTVAGERLAWTETTTSDLAMADEAYLHLLTQPDFEGSDFVLVAAFKERVFCVYDFRSEQEAPSWESAPGTDWLRNRPLH